MSFNSIHMQFPMTQPRNLQHDELTVAQLKNMTWEEILADNHQLTGYTRFNDFSIIAAVLKSELHIQNATELLGYAGGGGSVNYRLSKRNCSDILSTYKMLIRAEKLPKDHYSTLLKNASRRRLGTEARRIGRQLCQNAVEKANGVMAKAAENLKISVALLEAWLTA